MSKLFALKDISSEGAFENHSEYICGFYRGKLYREYPYLTLDLTDEFVAETVDKVNITILAAQQYGMRKFPSPRRISSPPSSGSLKKTEGYPGLVPSR